MTDDTAPLTKADLKRLTTPFFRVARELRAFGRDLRLRTDWLRVGIDYAIERLENMRYEFAELPGVPSHNADETPMANSRDMDDFKHTEHVECGRSKQ